MTKQLISMQSHVRSLDTLNSLYSKRLIPPEKKPFLIDANASAGPFMKVDGDGYICDLASQIASVGLGFSAGALFGAAQYLESWLGQTTTGIANAIQTAFAELLQRKIGSDQFQVSFCSSGAEAIELGLIDCFEKYSGTRRKILAFENSFHGRMLVALSCTHNPAKREPFALPGLDTTFVPYPEISNDDIHTTENTKQESEILATIDSHLKSNEYFAVLIEPIQCEGGDRYSSAFFHNRLVRLCNEYEVPLVYDEIQSGFGLGGEFFWHRMFDLNESGQELFPDIVVSAKKAQVGVVISRLDKAFENVDDVPVNFASLSRGYIQASMIDQFQNQIEFIETTVQEKLQRLVSDFSELISRPRNKGVCFAFDFIDSEQCQNFIGKRFDFGLLFYPAGTKTARFRFNLSFHENEITFAFKRLRILLEQLQTDKQDKGDSTTSLNYSPGIPKVDHHFEFHSMLVQAKLGTTKVDTHDYLQRQLERIGYSDCDVHFPNSKTFSDFREQIIAIQERVYEPARQSPIEEFDRVYEAANQLSIILTIENSIIGMAFAAPLNLFPEISGNLENSSFEDPNAHYMLDLTVDKNYRGGLGRILKQALVLLAIERGVTEIHGRNRDQLARSMWAINLSLGSHTTNYMKDNYKDDEKYRDCFYYRSLTQWEDPAVNLSDAIDCPLGPGELSEPFVRKNLGVMVNKLTHSNFITTEMAHDLPIAFESFGSSLRHGYTASSLSEAVDKIIKVLWLKRNPRNKILAIEGGFWGTSSFMARSLSNIGTPFFEIDSIPFSDSIVEQTKNQIESNDYMAFFIEPLMTNSMRRIDREILSRIIQVCRENELPVIYNETASLFYRYSKDHFAASHIDEICPDGTIAFLGGQMALVGVNQSFFADNPLMLISTWDGDAFSLARFVEAKRKVEQDRSQHQEVVEQFVCKLNSMLKNHNDSFEILNGVGWVNGDLPGELQSLFSIKNNRAIVCPSYWQMKQWLSQVSDS